jgi:MarR family transcriptional regulator, 2-MHQ and catechol-resistance regulon repressor
VQLTTLSAAPVLVPAPPCRLRQAGRFVDALKPFRSARSLSFPGVGDLSTLLEDPLAHRALEALVRAETRVTRRLAHELERRGASATGFSMLVVLYSAGGAIELRLLRQRLGLSKANATEVIRTLESRGLVQRIPSLRDGRALVIHITPGGEALLEDAFPGHARRVRDAFTPLDEEEKRELTRLCRKLDRAA